MSQVLSTFRSAFGTAVGSSMHVTVVLVVGVAAALASILFSVLGLFAGPVFNAVFLAPVTLAAMVGSAHAARHGQDSWTGARSAVENHWANLVGAFGLVAIVWVVIGGLFGLVFVLGAVGLESLSVETLTEFDRLRAGTQALLVTLPSIVVLGLSTVAGMVLQFVAPAAVVADASATESLRTAVRFTLANPLGVIGFSLTAVGVTALAALPIVGVAAAVWYLGSTGAVAVILFIGYLEVATVAGAITSMALVEYFETVADPTVLPEGVRIHGGTTDTGSFEFGTGGDDSGRL